MSERDFNQAVDRAVREMMDVDASAGFEARVNAGLRVRQRARRSWIPFAAVGTLAAAAATLLLLVTAMPDDVVMPERPAPPWMVLRAPDTRPADPPQVAVRNTTPNDAAAPRRQPATLEISLRVDGELHTIAPLEELDPLAIAPVQARNIEPGALDVTPLATIPTVTIDPLPSTSGGRN
jgi:hypothetical protein